MPAGRVYVNDVVDPRGPTTMLRPLMTYDPWSSDEDNGVAAVVASSIDHRGELPFEWTRQEQAYIDANDSAKWRDYVVYRYKMRVYPRDMIVADFPTYLLVEPVSACNLRCVMCFQVDKTFARKPYMGVMDFDLYTSVIDDAVDGGTRAVTMASRGEPTLHPRLGDMLDYASGRFIDLKLNTNATKLTEELSRRILSSGLTELVFSIEAQEPELYSRIRVGGKFTEVVRNIERFNEIRLREFPSSKLVTTASGVFFREDQDVDAYTKFWSTRVDHVATVECESRWDTYNNEPHPTLTHPCTYLWERAYVWWDGRMNPCDIDYKSHLQVGDLTTMSIADVWHGEAYKALRADHAAGNRAAHPPCDRCGV